MKLLNSYWKIIGYENCICYFFSISQKIDKKIKNIMNNILKDIIIKDIWIIY